MLWGGLAATARGVQQSSSPTPALRMAESEALTEAAFHAFLRNHKPAETSFTDAVTGFYHAITW